MEVGDEVWINPLRKHCTTLWNRGMVMAVNSKDISQWMECHVMSHLHRIVTSLDEDWRGGRE